MLACAGGEAPEPAPPPALPAAAAPAPPPRDAALDTLFARLEEESGGVLGVAALDVETGRAIGWREDEPFPMASVVKLPIALLVLRRVDEGALDLADSIALRPADYRPGRARFTRASHPDSVVVDLAGLLELAAGESDNAAADALLARVGGPAAVAAHLRSLGVEGIDVSRSEGRVLSDWAGIPPPADGGEVDRDDFYRFYDTLSAAERAAAEARWTADPRDAATPAATAALLARLARGEALSAEGTARLLAILEGTATGAERIRGLLPPGTRVAHKTGSIGSTTNDAGIVTVAGGRRFAVAVYVKGSTRPQERRERAIAEAARAVVERLEREGD